MASDSTSTLPQAQEAATAAPGDRRREDDHDWLADGTRVTLIGLEKKPELNSQVGTIIGYHNQHHRYKVRLEEDGSTKVLAKKNLVVPAQVGQHLPGREGGAVVSISTHCPAERETLAGMGQGSARTAEASCHPTSGPAHFSERAAASSGSRPLQPVFTGPGKALMSSPGASSQLRLDEEVGAGLTSMRRPPLPVPLNAGSSSRQHHPRSFASREADESGTAGLGMGSLSSRQPHASWGGSSSSSSRSSPQPSTVGLGAGLLAISGNLAPLPSPQDRAMPSSSSVCPAPVPALHADLPTEDVVREAIRKLDRDVTALQRQCAAREEGRVVRGEAVNSCFLRLTASRDECADAAAGFEDLFGGEATLKDEADRAVERADDCLEDYQGMRTWSELLQDEISLAHSQVKKHGLLGTLRSEVVEVGRDAADMGSSASALMPGLVQQARTTLSGVVQTGSQHATTVVGAVSAQSHRRVATVVQQHVVQPVKRTWHLVLFALLFCYVLPLFGLRMYSPFNAVVANLGVVYSGIIVIFPPKWARHRAAKSGLLLLWPLLLVALPLFVHYWVMNPRVTSHGFPADNLQPRDSMAPAVNSVATPVHVEREGGAQSQHRHDEGQVVSNPLQSQIKLVGSEQLEGTEESRRGHGDQHPDEHETKHRGGHGLRQFLSNIVQFLFGPLRHRRVFGHSLRGPHSGIREI